MAIVETAVAFLGSKLAAYAAGAGGAALAAGVAVKFGKPKLQAWLEGQIAKAMNPAGDDPKAKELFVAWFKPFLVWAEYMVPDKGDTRLKDRTAALLSKHMSPIIANAIGTVVQELEAAADDTLKKAASK